MEPFKALTLLAAAGIVSLVGAGAAGFYAGYTAAQGNFGAIGPGSPGSASVSLKPVLEDIKALSKQVESLAAAGSRTASESERNTKPFLDEIKSLARQLEGYKGLCPAPAGNTAMV